MTLPEKVTLSCLKKGCPRKLKIPRTNLESYVPADTVEIKSFCPWHEQHGHKDAGERYYNTEGIELAAVETEDGSQNKGKL